MSVGYKQITEKTSKTDGGSLKIKIKAINLHLEQAHAKGKGISYCQKCKKSIFTMALNKNKRLSRSLDPKPQSIGKSIQLLEIRTVPKLTWRSRNNEDVSLSIT